MDVECTLHGNGFKIPDNTEGNKVLVIKNDTGYHNVNIIIKEFFEIHGVCVGMFLLTDAP